MIKTPTVFILGAGASVNYGLPLGRDLVKNIISGGISNQLFKCLRPLKYGRQHLAGFMDALGRSASLSVDDFLEHREDFVEIGKAIIAYYLLGDENKGKLFRDLEKSWYVLLLNKMNAPFDDFGSNKVSIITFNYDRSLEQFLLTAMRKRHNKSEEEVASKLREIPIVHVHGQLGLLHWQADKKTWPSVVDYSEVRGPEEVANAARNIIIVPKGTDDTPEFRRAHELIQQSKRIYFLGFGYHDDNMRRLKVPFEGTKEFDQRRYIDGSCFGLTEAEKGALHGKYGKYINLGFGSSDHNVYHYLRNNRTFQM